MLTLNGAVTNSVDVSCRHKEGVIATLNGCKIGTGINDVMGGDVEELEEVEDVKVVRLTTGSGETKCVADWLVFLVGIDEGAEGVHFCTFLREEGVVVADEEQEVGTGGASKSISSGSVKSTSTHSGLKKG